MVIVEFSNIGRAAERTEQRFDANVKIPMPTSF